MQRLFTLATSRHLTDTCLANALGQVPITGGIICFSVEPKTKNIYVLLGRETCFDRMDSHNGRWCDFGGKINCHESVISGAAREFAEESLCLVQLPAVKNKSYTKYMEQVKVMLLEEDYFMKMTFTVNNQLRVYYLKEVPWQPEIEHRFAETREKLLSATKDPNALPFSLRHHPAVNKSEIDLHFLEKQSVAWWSIDRLAEVVDNQGRFKRQKFRRLFLPILRSVVYNLQKLYA